MACQLQPYDGSIRCWPVRLWFCSAFKAEVRHGIDLSIVRDLLLAAQVPSPRSTLWLQFCAGITERKRDPFFPATSNVKQSLISTDIERFAQAYVWR
jgi:hypothetical protein